MIITDQIRARAVFQELAQRHGTTSEAVRASMQECIDAAWDSPDPTARARQQQLFPNGKPSVETFLLRVTEVMKGQ